MSVTVVHVSEADQKLIAEHRKEIKALDEQAAALKEKLKTSKDAIDKIVEGVARTDKGYVRDRAQGRHFLQADLAHDNSVVVIMPRRMD